ncbi:MAG: hypothetical protein V4731_05470 [Pseudomonadota bacterium]
MTIPLTHAELLAVANAPRQAGPCANCQAIAGEAWASLPAGFDEASLRLVGTLAEIEPENEPTLEEFHPHGTYLWSPEAPVALRFHPYNRCTVHACQCGRPFLRYTEYGGYYIEPRIRALLPELIVVA